MKRQTIKIIAATACAALGMLLPHGAQAKWSRHQAFECVSDPPYHLGSHTIRNSTGGYINVSCGVDDTDLFSKGEVSTLNVHVFQEWAGDATFAKACVTYWDTFGGSCGTWTSNMGASGSSTLSPSLTAFNGTGAAADFGYLSLLLSSGSHVKGFFTAD